MDATSEQQQAHLGWRRADGDDVAWTTADRVLLGHSPHCQWFVGGDARPVMAVIYPTKDAHQLDVLHDHPGVFVNGQRVRHATIRHGDCLSIGDQYWQVLTQPILAEQSTDNEPVAEILAPTDVVTPTIVAAPSSVETQSTESAKRPAVSQPQRRGVSLGRTLAKIAEQSSFKQPRRAA